jgi:multicomponent Na+:H+ antiporter subunit D
LLVSALLTAGYLLPVTINGFFPGEGTAVKTETKEPAPAMLIPLAILAAAAVLMGLFPNPLIQFSSRIASAIM